MLNAAILEVIIGLIFVYSLMSILVTQINSLITQVLNTRAKHLKKGIESLLTDPVTRAKFLGHPLIQLVAAEVSPTDSLSAQTADAVTSEQANTVNWIPSELFVRSLFDIISANAGRNLYAPLETAIESVLNGAEKAMMREMLRRLQSSGLGVIEFRTAVEGLKDPADQDALFSALARIELVRTDLGANNEQSKLIPLLDGIAQIQDPVLQRALQTLLASARSLKEAEEKIAFWFNARMDQLSSLYKRNMQFLSLIIGLVLTLLLNVDSFYLARTLWEDPALRQAVNLAAQDAIESGELQRQIEAGQNAIDSTPTPELLVPTLVPTLETGIAIDPAAEPPILAPTLETGGVIDPNAETPIFEAAAQTIPQVVPDEASVGQPQDTIFTLLDLRIPIGWDFITVESGCPSTAIPDPCGETRNLWALFPGNNPGWFGLLLIKLIGLAITTIAISQGAPFWFDLLNRLARGRNSSDG